MESWIFADFDPTYMQACGNEIVVPVFNDNATEIGIQDRAIRYNSSLGLIMV